MSAVIHGLIGGMAAAALGAVALNSQKSAKVDREGWNWLRPGWYVHLALGGCVAFVMAMSYFFWLGGSARSDADDQNFSALLLLLAFGAGALWLVWAGYLHKVAWRGNDIRFRRPLRSDAYYRFTDIVSVSASADGSELKLQFADARRLRVNLYFHGFNDFVRQMDNRLFPLDS